MASLAAILRKSASSMATPLSLQFISSRAKNQGSLFFPLNRASTALLQGPSSVPRYSSSIASLKRPASDEALLRLVNREIKCEEEKKQLDQTGEVPNGIHFQIDRRCQSLSLTGKYHNETIKLDRCYLIHKACTYTDSSEEYSEDDGSDDEGKDNNGFSISLDVCVSKENGSSLNFHCTGFPDKITIDGVSAKYSQSSDDREIERSIRFSELDEDTQKALNKYLEMRGINTGTISFLHQCIVNKEESKKEHLKGLKNLEKFLEA